MRTDKIGWIWIALVCIALSTAAVAGDEVTVEGKMICAKCSLQEVGHEGCQSVLAVEGEGDEPTLYYIEMNDVAESFGHACGAARPARVTGTTEDRDGKTWIVAVTIEETASDDA